MLVFYASIRDSNMVSPAYIRISLTHWAICSPFNHLLNTLQGNGFIENTPESLVEAATTLHPSLDRATEAIFRSEAALPPYSPSFLLLFQVSCVLNRKDRRVEPGDGWYSFGPAFPWVLPQGCASLLWLAWIVAYPSRVNQEDCTDPCWRLQTHLLKCMAGLESGLLGQKQKQKLRLWKGKQLSPTLSLPLSSSVSTFTNSQAPVGGIVLASWSLDATVRKAAQHLARETQSACPLLTGNTGCSQESYYDQTETTGCHSSSGPLGRIPLICNNMSFL